MSVDGYIRRLAREYRVPGMGAEDVEQECRIAAWQAPDHARLAARRQVFDLLRVALRKPMFVEIVEVAAPDTVADVVDARERLRCILAEPRTANEREALRRVLRGEPVETGNNGKALSVALWRLRQKLAA